MKIDTKTNSFAVTMEEIVSVIDQTLNNIWISERTTDPNVARQIQQFNDGADMMGRRIKDFFQNEFDKKCAEQMAEGKGW